MAGQLNPSERSLPSIVQSLIEVIKGRLNNTATVTLVPNVSETVVPFVNSSRGSVVILEAMSASAAAEVASGNLWISDVGQRTFTIQHTNSGVADRKFGFIVQGGG